MKLGSSRAMDTKRPRGSERSKPRHEVQLTRRSQPTYPWPPEQAQPGVSKPCRTTLKIDPNDPDALAGEVASYELEYIFWASPETDYEAKVIGQADRAIALAPDTMRAYYPKSVYLYVAHRADEALRTADAGLAINPNYAQLYGSRSTARSSLGQFEQAKSDAQQAIRLSPRDPLIGLFNVQLGDAELGLGHFDAAIDEYHNATESGYRPFFAYTNLAAAYALEDKMDEATSALAEARRLNPKLTVKWMIAHTPNLPPVSKDCARRDCRRSERRATGTSIVAIGNGRFASGRPLSANSGHSRCRERV